jgi:hypothetical protein
MKRAVLKFFDRTNPVMIRVLTSRAHRLMSSGLCVIEYSGRKSGRSFRLPVGYHDIDGVVIVSTSIAPERNWWRNFVDGHPARLCVKGQWREMQGRVLEPGTDEYRQWVEAIFRRGRVVSKAMGVDFDPKVGLSDEAVESLAENSCVTIFE